MANTLASRQNHAPDEHAVGEPAQDDGSAAQSDVQAEQLAPPSPAITAGHPAAQRKMNWRRWVAGAVVIMVLVAVGFWLAPLVQRRLNTISTDDAYVNGHVTFVARGSRGRLLACLWTTTIA